MSASEPRVKSSADSISRTPPPPGRDPVPGQDARITLQKTLGGTPFRFQGDVRPRVVVGIAEAEYDTKTTLPPLVQRVLVDQLGYEAIIINMPTSIYDHEAPDALDLPYGTEAALRIVPFQW